MSEQKPKLNRLNIPSLPLSNFVEPVQIVAIWFNYFLLLNLVWSSAASKFNICAFRDDLLHSLVESSAYMSYRCFCIRSKQCAPHLLLLFWPFFVNPRDCCVEKFPFWQNQQFLRYSDQPVRYNNHTTFKVT